jgi:o-succinylbenzoate---CoA ligase
MSLSILEAARDSKDRLAIISSNVRATFEELGERVGRLLGGLSDLGLDGTSDVPRAAVVGTNSLETVELILALIELGEPFVLLHPKLTERERDAILEEVRPIAVLDRDRHAELSTSRRAFERRPIPDERCLAVIYTSGTAGRSKGAMLSRCAFIASADASAKNLGWQDDDRWLACIPLAHVGALSVVTRCLLARRTIVVEEAGMANVENLAKTMERERVTIASLVPTVLARLFAVGWSPPPSLRAILLGGAGASASLLEEARARRVPVLTTYGLTEACSQVTTQKYGTPPSVEQGAGEPLPGFEVRIRDDEIQVKSPALMAGYFPIGAHPDPILADGFLATGDYGRFDQAGRLHVLARRTDLIVTGGENVYPAEVEAALLAIPGVEAACVFGIADETWGQVVAAAVVAMNVTDAAIAQHLAGALAPFKRPRRIACLDRMPLTRSEKIDRAAARRQAEPKLRPLARELSPVSEP